MGVQNLWVLLAPVGRQIEIESLSNKVLAVDASIWLTQFVKAMRDDEGNMIKNAHLIGTFHRVAKLLFFGIKPVFVFDGATPEIKKRTTARRRRHQEHQAANLKQTAQRILINRLKLQREQLKRNGEKAAPAVDPNFVLPEQKAPAKQKDSEYGNGGEKGTNSTGTATTTVQGGMASAIEIDTNSSAEEDDDEAKDEEIQRVILLSSIAQEEEQKQVSGGGYENVDENGDDHDDGDDLTIDDIVLDTSRISKIDLQAVFALPAHLQKDMINRILSDRRQEVRNKFIPLAGKPEAYSHTQISSFLATTALHKRIEAAKKQNREKQTEALANSPQSAKFGPGKRIASRSDRFFVYKKASENRFGEEEDDDSDDKEKARSDSEDGDLEKDELSVVNEIEQFEDEVRRSVMFASATGATGRDHHGTNENSFPLLHQFKKRRYRDENGEEIGKRTLTDTDFSVASVKEFAKQAERQQMRKWSVQEAAAAWVAKNETQMRSEPTLAIERARRKRLKIEDQTANGDVGGDGEKTEKSEANALKMEKNITISFKTDDVEAADDKFLELFPASMFETHKEVKPAQGVSPVQADEDAVPNDNATEDEGEVDWEDVLGSSASTAPVIEEKPRDVPVGKVPTAISKSTLEPADTIVTGEDDEDENDVEWEEVENIEQKISTPEPTLTTVGESKSEDGFLLSAAASLKDTDESEGEGEEDVEDNDEMYLSLKNELEDAKAEEDLEELRGEALKSALATASNLTQWAAGAVRRALAAHSLQHKQFVESEHPITGKSSPRRGSGASFEEAIDVPEDEEEEETKDGEEAEETKSEELMTRADKEAVVIDADEEGKLGESLDVGVVVDEDQQLQMAIANSMAEDLDKPRVSRYLQYSSPAPAQSLPLTHTQILREEIVDVAAIESEQTELKKLRNRQMRDVEGFNDDMVEEVMELLRLFGVPFLVCPMEAEAQCAALEQLGLVDGIITDDSDIFPFGGRKVYKNIFHNQKFVEAFFAEDIEQELGFSQEEMISLALLLGSDYTDGIRGIGIVNATEVVNAYPGINGLQDFKQWVQSFDLAEEAQRVADKKAKKSETELSEMDVRERFQYSHASARRKWELGDEFPNAQVVKAYKQPHVDRSDARFSWDLPDLAALREYTRGTFGWDRQKTDGVLLPLLQKAASAGRGVQTRIDQFFTTYNDEVRYAKIQSKRLRSAVESRATKKKSAASGSGGTSAKKPATSSFFAAEAASSPANTEKKITKKKTTLEALGFGPKK